MMPEGLVRFQTIYKYIIHPLYIFVKSQKKGIKTGDFIPPPAEG